MTPREDPLIAFRTPLDTIEGVAKTIHEVFH